MESVPMNRLPGDDRPPRHHSRRLELLQLFLDRPDFLAETGDLVLLVLLPLDTSQGLPERCELFGERGDLLLDLLVHVKSRG